MAADLPVSSIHRQLASALDLIVHISRLPGGMRVVTQITEVLHYDPDEKPDHFCTTFSNYRNGASLRATGYLPSFIDSLVEKELLDMEFFIRPRRAQLGDIRGNTPENRQLSYEF